MIESKTSFLKPMKKVRKVKFLGFHYWIKSDEPQFYEGPIVDSGLVILSKYKIVSAEFVSYGFGILSDSAADKGLLYAKIQIKDTYMHLFNTHLQASYYSLEDDDLFDLCVASRLEQVKLMKNNIHSLLTKSSYKKTETVVLVGDLNLNSLQEKTKLKETSHIKAFHSEEFNEYEEALKILNGEDDEWIAVDYMQ